ncbi:MAG: class I SAM-dependent methyltransferase [Actinobacteria bacterium]|jgi:ubiquinone/menaquinone biosynthesis C-methylase UbiE|nr:class I SAM-dependent methyltransferase [Actinomycetota bacterium]MCL6095627.1 class I SAM-dependent methyltransferase [Actinomycetota bacterium]
MGNQEELKESTTHDREDSFSGRHSSDNLLQSLREDWDELARIDPLWAILSRADKKYMAWEIDEFMSTGSIEADKIMKEVGALGKPELSHTALDFGCGVGRVTRRLAHYFDQVVGIDISPEMIRIAKELNGELTNISFEINIRNDLSIFPDDSFDLVYSSRVLQHLPNVDIVKHYISEFIRIVNNKGIVCFQLPARISWVRRYFSKRQIYKPLRQLGFAGSTLYKIAGLHPMELITVPENEVVLTVNLAGGNIIKTVSDEKEIYFYKEGYIYYVIKS